MGDTHQASSGSFSTGKRAQERVLAHVPDVYKVNPCWRPTLTPSEANDVVPIIDISGLRKGPSDRSLVIQAIRQACLDIGFFHVVNHGIPEIVLEKALAAAFGFFELPLEERVKLMSSDVHKPVRYGTSLKDGDVDKIHFWRIFLKHYSNPLTDWITCWPHNPSNYREDIGKYSRETMKLAMELTEAMTESLGLSRDYLSEKMEKGMQVMALNCYPPCPDPHLTLGLPPHSDYSCFTILLQSSSGLEILDADDSWRMVPVVSGALQVHIGDHLEVLSNGVYRSVVHRVRVNTERTRISLASLYSLGKEDKVGVAEELLEGVCKRGYKESSFQDFMEFLSQNDLSDHHRQSFLDSLKIIDGEE